MGVVIRCEALVGAVACGLGQGIGDRLDGGCDRCAVRRLRSGAGDGAGRRGAAPGGGGGGLGGPRRGGPLERRRCGGLRPGRPRGPGAERTARPVRGRGRGLGRDGGIRKGAVHGGGQIEGGPRGRTCRAWGIYRICGVLRACGIFRIREACGIFRRLWPARSAWPEPGGQSSRGPRFLGSPPPLTSPGFHSSGPELSAFRS